MERVESKIVTIGVKSYAVGVQSDGANIPTLTDRADELGVATEFLRQNKRVRHVFFYDVVVAEIEFEGRVVLLQSGGQANRSVRYIAGVPMTKREISARPDLMLDGVERMLNYVEDDDVFVVTPSKSVYNYFGNEGDVFITL